MIQDDARRREIDRLFDAALDLGPEERQTFLSAECRDPEVRRAVERLLQSSEDTVSLLEDASPWKGHLGDQLAQDLALDPAARGERIGPYRIVREIGRGGMASVYLGERADGHFEQRVALKLANTVIQDQEELLRRFHLERQILASLDHPNIARLVDGGLTEGGRPFFAMELIRGAPIDRYCDEHRLPVEQRLALMVDVARGVEAAHRALIVHRDLKPSNVMVTEEGVVKVLDFGIAKQMDADSLGMTRTAAGLMTPEYASPEQYRGELVTTASDVYQLGLLLYQTLVGERPYQLGGLSPGQALEMVCERPPERPSTRVKKLTRTREATTEIGERRRIRPERLQRLLTGDLDTLVMTALHKDPRRRYRSAAELADDLESYLAGRPIRARGDSPLYLIRKLLHRHRVAVAAAAVALTALVGVVAFYTARLGEQRNVARLEAQRAAASRDAALTARREAEETTEFLAQLFQQSDPWKQDGLQLTARDLLDRGAEKVRLELAGQPTTQARLMDTIGNVYRRLGLYDDAEPLHEEALALRREHLPEDHPDLAESYFHLAYLHHNRTDDLAEANELFRRALRIQEAQHGPSSQEVAMTLTGLANNLREMGEAEEAVKILDRLLDIEHTRYGEEHEEIAATLVNLGATYHQLEREEEAIEVFERALAMERKLLGPEHFRVSTTLNNLGMVYDRRGDEAHAAELFAESLRIKEKTLGPDHPTVASGLINLASTLGYAERGEEAAALLHRAVDLLQRRAPRHRWLGDAYTNLAAVALERNDFEETKKYFELAFEIRLAALGPTHPTIGAAYYNFGELYQRQERYRDAAQAFERAMEIWRESLAPDHIYVGFGLAAAAETRLATGDLAAAEELFPRALDILKAKVNETHEMRRRATEGYAELLDRLGRPDEAQALRAELPG